MTVFVSDSFTDTNGTTLASHTGETGATWTKHTGSGSDTLEIQSNRLTDNGSSNDAVYYASGTPADRNYDVEADITADSGVTIDSGVLGQVDTTASTYYLAQYNAGNGWRLFKRVSGSYTQLGSYSQTLTSGNTYALKLELRSTPTQKVFVDTVERISTTDSAISSAGKAGIRFDTLKNVNGRLDNFTATDTSGGSSVSHLVGGKLAGSGILLEGLAR